MGTTRTAHARTKRLRALALALALGGGWLGATQAQDAAQTATPPAMQPAADNLPALDAASDPWKVDVYYENDTHYRGKDATGSTVGQSKFRNTLQVEADKKLGSGWGFHGVLRGTYDGVYRLNDDQYGKKAGGPITLQSTVGGQLVAEPYAGTSFLAGGSIVDYDTVATAFGLTGNAFLNSADLLARSPNEGMRVLGDRWHGINGGVAFGVPVRPCNIDPRGCVDFGGYGDLKLSELEAPEFNKRLDFIREAYVKNELPLENGDSVFVKVGRQQVVWGRTDLFRVLDVINPVDYSRNNIYDELQDIRIPMWIAQAEWRMGASETMQDRNLQVVWNFDQFRPNNLGQCGSPNVILDAGCFFRGMKTLWDYGGTVANFANVGPGTLLATNFGPHQIGLADVHLPEWSLKNTQLGIKYEGITQGGLSFSLNALTYRSQLPSLRGGLRAVNSFTGVYQDAWPYLISFDMYFPRVNLLGGSMDFQVESAKAAVRLEAAFTDGEEFPNTARPGLYSKNRVFRSVIGIDRPTFVPFISETRTTLFSAQLFYQHIFDHELYSGTLGPVGMPDWKDNAIGTLLMKAFFANDRVSPQVVLARDFKAHAYAIVPSLDWIVSDDLKLTFGANVKGGDTGRTAFDDCRSCNPFPPYTAPYGDAEALEAYSRGLASIEPLGRFRAGPIGAAFKENEVFVTLRYKF